MEMGMEMGEEILHQIVVFVDPAHIALLSIDYAHQEPLKAKLGTTVISVQLHSLPGIDEPAPVDIVPAAAAAPILGDAVTPVGATPIVFDVLSVVFAAPFAFDIPIAFDTPVAFDALIAFDIPAADAMLAVAIQPAI